VTFMPRTPPPSPEASPLTLPSLGPGRLYSRSFDGLGLQAAMARWAQELQQRQQSHDPCRHVGFKAAAAPAPAAAAAAGSPKSAAAAGGGGGVGVHGSGDWRACKAGVVQLLPKGHGPCRYSKCGLAGSFLPPVEGKCRQK